MSTIDFRQHLKEQELEHCCICGKPLIQGKDEILIDENDDVWCYECNEEFARRIDAIYEDMKKRKKKQKGPVYYTVRDIKTGKVFLAEYDCESAAYYEKGTGREFDITEVESL